MCNTEISVQNSESYVCVVGRCNTCNRVFDVKVYNTLGECPHCNFKPDYLEGESDQKDSPKIEHRHNTQNIAKYAGLKPPWED